MYSLLFAFLILAGCHGKKTLPAPTMVQKQVDSPLKKNKPKCHSIPKRFHDESPKMIKIEARKFIMGTDDKNSYASERPAHEVMVNSFWIDETEITNHEFAEFVKATGHETVAERKPEWSELKKQLPPDTPPPHPSQLVPASMVFIPPQGKVDLDHVNWWVWVPGANWMHPEGPGSSIEKRLNHPVTHVAFEDAMSFCRWKKKRLPTEAEWEVSARGGSERNKFAWGNELRPSGKFMANTFQGEFPYLNKSLDGFANTAPVKSFPANGYGLYDMIGNVWEWTSDFFDSTYYKKINTTQTLVNPKGPTRSFDPAEPYAIKHVIKGGSYLCSDDYCVNYRPSARLGAAFDSGAGHIGFRCAKDDHSEDIQSGQ